MTHPRSPQAARDGLREALATLAEPGYEWSDEQVERVRAALAAATPAGLDDLERFKPNPLATRDNDEPAMVRAAGGRWVSFDDVARLAAATPEPPDLSAAWRAMEEAKPSRTWRLTVGERLPFGEGYQAHVQDIGETPATMPRVEDGVSWFSATGDTPAAALNALAAALAQQPETGEPR